MMKKLSWDYRLLRGRDAVTVRAACVGAVRQHGAVKRQERGYVLLVVLVLMIVLLSAWGRSNRDVVRGVCRRTAGSPPAIVFFRPSRRVVIRRMSSSGFV